MTVSTTTSTAQFDPNGVTINFPFAFRFFAATDLKVFWQKPDGTIQLLVLNSNYTVQGVGNAAGGSITTIGTPLPNGRLVVSRIMVATQLTSFRNQGEFFAEIHEDAFDKLVMLVQQTIDSQGRGLTVPVADPLGINLVLPSAVARAGKVLGFDQEGEPVVSSLSLEQIEQQPALALEAAAQAQQSAADALASRNAAGDSASAAAGSAGSAAGSATAAAASAVAASNAGLQMGMSNWGYRPQPFAGFALDDGQELDRAVYPSFAAALDAGLLPTVTQAQWDADPGNRACFVANSSTGKFRMRDRNGMSAGSYGAVMERGGSGPVLIKRDQMQKMAIQGRYWNSSSAVSGNSYADTASVNPGGPSGQTLITINPFIADGVNGAPRLGSETYPTHATGAWMTRLFGIITPLGSAEAASLAAAYAAIASDVTNKLNPLWVNRFKTARRSLVDIYTSATGWAAGQTIVLYEDIRNFEAVTARWSNITAGGVTNLQHILDLADYPYGTEAYLLLGVGGAADYRIRFNDIGDGTYRSMTMVAAGASATPIGVIRGHRATAFQ